MSQNVKSKAQLLFLYPLLWGHLALCTLNVLLCLLQSNTLIVYEVKKVVCETTEHNNVLEAAKFVDSLLVLAFTLDTS